MFILTQQNSVANHWLADLRNIQTQKNRAVFRQNMCRIGEVLAYEISKTFHYHKKEVQTPLGTAQVQVSDEKIVLATILRAGLPFYQGFLNVFENAESAFIGAYRSEPQDDESFEIQLHYSVAPDLSDKILILTDPMLATGKSLSIALKKLLKNGKPKCIHIAAIIGSKAGVAYLQENIFDDFSLWLGDLDNELNPKSYIVPGLGDAGDLAFGAKL
ncbi:MAG: uracil phosphoribosyltransferase [Raineya sp.]|nr:uracil phosphoribosyltransferase [Raineya sp.]MDW8296923.1 uracil phosphoribosyltransferase [Raineya sp.]